MRRQPSRRVLAAVAIVIGIGLIVMPLALSLFPKSGAGERVTDRFRAQMSTQGLATLKKNFDTVGAFTTQLSKQAAPAFAHDLGMTEAQFNRYLERNFPDVATGLAAIPPAAKFVGPVIPLLIGAHDEFVSVDSLPGLGLPITSIPWLLIGAGVVLIGLGAVMTRSAGRGPVIALAVVGLGMIVVPFALSLPSKANDAKNISDLGKVALSQQAANKAAAATKVIDATVTQTGAKLLPAIANRTGRTVASIDREFPAVATGVREWPMIAPGAYHLSSIQSASVEDNKQMGGTPFKALPWLIVVPGIILTLLAGLALLGMRKPDQAT